MKVAVFGDHFVRASLLEQSLRQHLGPLVEELIFSSRELPYPMEPAKHNAEIREFVGEPEEVLETAAGAEVVMSHMPPLSASVLRRLPDLRAIGCCRTEPVNINVQVATERGIPIFYAPGRNARAVAEFTVGLIIAECRNIARGHRSLADGVWRTDLYLYEHAPRELNGQTVGLIGFGHIGSIMPSLLRPFGLRVLAYDPYVEDGVFAAKGAERVSSLDALLADSDIVSLHARVTPETRGFLGEAQFRRMKRGAYFINTARGPMVDYDALYRALADGHLAGSGLETFAVEPLPPDSPLARLPNVTLTPHIAGCSRESVILAAEMVSKDLARWYAGETPVHSTIAPVTHQSSRPRTMPLASRDRGS
jgi:D-3-phosphoglycerate dehydrogenase / 2-oxoglutarate reductase